MSSYVPGIMTVHVPLVSWVKVSVRHFNPSGSLYGMTVCRYCMRSADHIIM